MDDDEDDENDDDGDDDDGDGGDNLNVFDDLIIKCREFLLTFKNEFACHINVRKQKHTSVEKRRP